MLCKKGGKKNKIIRTDLYMYRANGERKTHSGEAVYGGVRNLSVVHLNRGPALDLAAARERKSRDDAEGQMGTRNNRNGQTWLLSALLKALRKKLKYSRFVVVALLALVDILDEAAKRHVVTPRRDHRIRVVLVVGHVEERRIEAREAVGREEEPFGR
jgi:hypothetical protein